MTEPNPRRSVDFEATGVVRPRRRRRPGPVVVAAGVVAIGLMLAVLKPWGGTVEPASVSPTSRPMVASTVPIAPVAALDPGDQAVAAEIGAAFRPHDGWGIAAVEASAGRDPLAAFRERWWPLPADGPGSDRPFDLPVTGPVGLGITAPLGQTPLDVRVYRLGPDDDWQWLDVAPAPSADVAGLDLLPPAVDGVPRLAWVSGRYRFDLLLGDTTEHLDVDIGRRAATGLDPWYLPPADPSVGVPPAPSRASQAEPSGPNEDEPGVIAVVGGVARAIGGAPRADVPSAADAWLDTSGTAVVQAAGVTAVGVVLPTDALDPRGIIRRLLPDVPFSGPVARIVTATAGGPPSTTVRFDLPAGQAFVPGVYALELGWSASDGPRSGTWIVEIAPGSSWRTPALLEAARRYRSYGGRDVLIAAVPSAGAQPIMSFPLPKAAGCGGPGILPQAVLGIGHHDGVNVDGVHLSRHGPLGGDLTVVVRRADAGPGLTLLAPFTGPGFTPGSYTLIVAEPDDLGRVPLCIAASSRG